MYVTKLVVQITLGEQVVGKRALEGKAGRVRDQKWDQNIRQSFSSAGWSLDDSFEGYLLIGHDGYRISLLAHREHWGADGLTFELLDHEDMTTYWVEEVPTPQQAAQLLEEHGQLPEE